MLAGILGLNEPAFGRSDWDEWCAGEQIFMAFTKQEPKVDQIRVTVRNNLIVNRNVQSSPMSQTELYANFKFKVDCSPARLFRYALDVDGKIKKVNLPSSKSDTIIRESILLGNVADLKRACGSANTGTIMHKIDLALRCKRLECVPDLDQTKHHEWNVPVVVTCEETKKTTARAVKWRHSCPPGYVIAGTSLQHKVTTNARPMQCHPKWAPSGKACPFIYTQDVPDGEWIEQGTILTYHNGKETERTQVTELTSFSGKILIREIDPETSYTDSLKVILYYEDGSKEVLLPKTEELRETDGNYLITNQGDEVVVDFGSPERKDFVRAELIADGYYELY
jgi:hypothetical protein